MYAKYIKRILDFSLSLFALIVLSPVMLIIGIAIKIDSKGLVFFHQERLGKNGKVFKIIKFRTMIANAENTGDKLRIKSENDVRITRVGKFLRKTSLDELPQLFNVIKGEMSLIGPRPPVTYYPYKYDDYSQEQKKRFNVKPGITGLAQVKVRNNASWDKRIEIDIKYIEKISFLEEVKIIIKTLQNIIIGKNIYQNQSMEMKDEKEKNKHVNV